MDKNVGTTDKRARLIVGAILLVVGVLSIVGLPLLALGGLVADLPLPLPVGLLAATGFPAAGLQLFAAALLGAAGVLAPAVDFLAVTRTGK